MVNLRLELFNFKKELDYETQDDIYNIVENHFNSCGVTSEKNIINSLNEKLEIYKYDKDVTSLLEKLNDDLKNYSILYNLKDLYKLIEQKNQGMIYRQTLNTILEIINTDNDEDRMIKIMNELAVQHDWVPEVNTFVYNLTNNPEKKQNLLKGGRAESVYTITESVEEGHLVFIKDSWFLLSENNKEKTVEKTLLENHIKNTEKVKTLRTLQKAVEMGDIDENKITFRINENLTIGFSVETPGVTFINEEKAEDESTLESIFNSPIIPIVNKGFYPILETTQKNLDKFVELDVVKKVTNISNPFLEVYAFNYGDEIHMYRCDSRQGTSLYKYENAFELVNDIQNELKYDLTYFYENFMDEEEKINRGLTDKVRELNIKLDEINENIDRVESVVEMEGENEYLDKALKILDKEKSSKETELLSIKELISQRKEKSIK